MKLLLKIEADSKDLTPAMANALVPLVLKFKGDVQTLGKMLPTSGLDKVVISLEVKKR